MTATQSPFARAAVDRLAGRPIPSSLNSDPEQRHFFDPPEYIQRALGGREWFFEQGARAVHRIGLFQGLGWEIDPATVERDNLQYTGFRVYMSPAFACTVQTVRRYTLTDPNLDASTTALIDEVKSIPDVPLTSLKATVENLLGIN